MPIQETEKYKKTIQRLKDHDDCCHNLFFMAGCGFGGGDRADSSRQFSEERLRQIAKERETYFTISEIKEFFDIEEAARLFFGLVQTRDIVLYEPHHFMHWFSQSSQRSENWRNIEKIIQDACKRIYGVPWGQQKQEIPTLVDPVGKFEKLPEEKVDKEGYLKILEMAEKDIVPFLINRPVYYKDELIGHVKEVGNCSIHLFSAKMHDDFAEDDEPENYNRDFYACCACSLYLHEYNLEVKNQEILDFKRNNGYAIPMIDLSSIRVSADKIELMRNTKYVAMNSFR